MPKTKIEAHTYYCPHFNRIVHGCTSHERPVFEVLTPAQAAELRALRRVCRAAVKWAEGIQGPDLMGLIDEKTHCLVLATRRASRALSRTQKTRRGKK